MVCVSSRLRMHDAYTWNDDKNARTVGQEGQLPLCQPRSQGHFPFCHWEGGNVPGNEVAPLPFVGRAKWPILLGLVFASNSQPKGHFILNSTN